MGQPSSISVSVDNTEYSRYEKGHDTISATIQLTGNGPYSSESIVVDIIKLEEAEML
jgi:hypothetical protein